MTHEPIRFLNMHSGYPQYIDHFEDEFDGLGTDTKTCALEAHRHNRIRRKNDNIDEEVEYYIHPTTVLLRLTAGSVFNRTEYADDGPRTDCVAVSSQRSLRSEETLVMSSLSPKECASLLVPQLLSAQRGAQSPFPLAQEQTYRFYLILLAPLFPHTYHSTTQRPKCMDHHIFRVRLYALSFPLYRSSMLARRGVARMSRRFLHEELRCSPVSA